MDNLGKLTAIRLNTAIIVGGQSLSYVSAEKLPGVELTMHPAGAVIDHKGKRLVVPYSNLAFLVCDAPAATAVEPKSGPVKAAK